MAASRSPEDVRNAVQDAVAKTIAGFSGLLAGVRQGVEDGRLADEARAAGESLVKVMREAAAGARDELRKKGQ